MSTVVDELSVFRSSNQDGEERYLTPSEEFWRDHTAWLKNCGYILRPRYQHGWVPSWKGTDAMFMTREDGIFLPTPAAMDARRIRDGAGVCLKKINIETFEFEHEIGSFFSSGSIANDPRNHCVPILETLFVPDNDKIIIIVMPLLRIYSNPRFDTFGEAVDFFGQIFEGMKFMHDHNVAHRRDCSGPNIMMDGSKLFPNGFHPQAQKRKPDFYSGRAKFYTRTQRPPKYYIIDFGFSSRYETRNPPPLDSDPIIGADKTVPEFQSSAGDPPKPYDPFPVDVYYLGNVILREFIEGNPESLRDDNGKKYGFEFMKALADDMTAEDPAKRPTMDEVVERFAVIRNGLSSWKLRSRVVKASD
ncbi:hypothetical protein C8R43DRAFT_925245, partial [Mycena crocata]